VSHRSDYWVTQVLQGNNTGLAYGGQGVDGGFVLYWIAP